MTAPQALASGSKPPAVAANGTAANGALLHPSTWEDWFRHASPRQRTDALRLAQSQGLLYPHQLPPHTNGVKAAPGKETAASALLARLLTGKAEPPPPFGADPILFVDGDLDVVQQQAVIRALNTPDVFMLEGLPGTGKTRVLAEIVVQTAARGRRVLVLSPHSAALDVLLARLQGRPEILAVRVLDALEKPDTLPGWLRGFTLEQQRQALLERTVAGARSNRERHESVCRQRGRQAPLWTRLQECLTQTQSLDRQACDLHDRLAGLKALVEKDSTAESANPLAMNIRQLRATCDAALRDDERLLEDRQAALAECERASAERSARMAALDAGYQAKKHGRIWSLAYWSNLFNSGIVGAMESLQEEERRAEQTKSDLRAEIERVQALCRQRREQIERDCQALIAAEADARRAALQREVQQVAEAQKLAEASWTELCAEVQAPDLPKNAAAIALAQERWGERSRQDEQQCQFARQWLEFIEQAGSQIAGRVPEFANVITSTIARWQSDAKFRDAADGLFDLVIIEDAEHLTDADVTKLARHGERCVLVSAALAEAPPPEKPTRSLLTAAVPATSAWHRLWTALGGQAGRWPCHWRREEGKLICQLIPLSAEDRQHLESEGLADAPDIELRILHRPRATPRLAEVHFGPGRSFDEAFRFMVQEVQEFPLEPLGLTGWWQDNAAQIQRFLGPTPGAHRYLELDPGVRLGIGTDESGPSLRIAVIEFSKEAGWDRAKAEEWLGRHRPIHDTERTVFLQRPYRFTRPLARLAQAVLRTSEWLACAANGVPDGAPACTFIAVPTPSKREWSTVGAGLELDLSATRQTERLPAGLRQGLPLRGYVNYPEAQALVHRLEAWAQKEALASMRVAVFALYQGQAELLRRLVQQSEILRNQALTLEVGLPSRARQRECDVAFVSLTRSHGQRAVAFGEEPSELPLALTRAGQALFLFGDPGTLVKRTQWQGPVDHLDARGAAEELQRIQRLVGFLQSQEHATDHVNGVLNGKE